MNLTLCIADKASIYGSPQAYGHAVYRVRVNHCAANMAGDLFATLPAPLPLYILLELPDVKALYAAVLSSPHLLAVFRLNACLLFRKIIRRNLSDDETQPILLYMRLYAANPGRHLDGLVQQCKSDDFSLDVNSNETLDVVLKGMSTAVVFRTIAQAVRIYDLARVILRSKLDYLTTLRYARLADLSFRYHRGTSPSSQRPESVPLGIPARLQDPSWIEENRVVRALWLLAIRCQGSKAVELDDKLSWLEDDVAEVEASLRTGPTLLLPTSTPEQLCNPLDIAAILRPYPTSHSPYREHTAAPMITSVCSSQPPAIKPRSSETTRAWQQESFRFSKENETMRFLRASTHRPDSPLQDHDASVFRRLGFTFWDRWRVSAELELRSTPRSITGGPLNGRYYSVGEPGYLGYSEEWFRLLKVYECEEKREIDGWQRGWTT